MKLSTRFASTWTPLLALTAAVLLAGCSATAAPAPSRAPVAWSGHGDFETTRVGLSGDYHALWTLSGSNCVFGAYLWGGLPVTVTAIATADGDTNLHGLAPDRYYLKVVSNCGWTVSLSPITD
jgi:hypothetical protein